MIITCNKKFLIQKCETRGYSIEDVMGCVLSQNNDIWTIDTDHVSYPKKKESGVGTELKKLLQLIGIKTGTNCKCNERVEIMNAKGKKWCEENINVIVGWLKEEADKLGLLFVPVVAKYLVKKAIKLAN